MFSQLSWNHFPHWVQLDIFLFLSSGSLHTQWRTSTRSDITGSSPTERMLGCGVSHPGNGVTIPFVKHASKCDRITLSSHMTALGGMPWQSEVVVAMEKRPQSSPPLCCRDSTDRTVKHSAGERTISAICRQTCALILFPMLSQTFTTFGGQSMVDTHSQWHFSSFKICTPSDAITFQQLF